MNRQDGLMVTRTHLVLSKEYNMGHGSVFLLASSKVTDLWTLESLFVTEPKRGSKAYLEEPGSICGN